MKNGGQEAVVSLNAKILKKIVVQVNVVDRKVLITFLSTTCYLEIALLSANQNGGTFLCILLML